MVCDLCLYVVAYVSDRYLDLFFKLFELIKHLYSVVLILLDKCLEGCKLCKDLCLHCIGELDKILYLVLEKLDLRKDLCLCLVYYCVKDVFDFADLVVECALEILTDSCKCSFKISEDCSDFFFTVFSVCYVAYNSADLSDRCVKCLVDLRKDLRIKSGVLNDRVKVHCDELECFLSVDSVPICESGKNYVCVVKYKLDYLVAEGCYYKSENYYRISAVIREEVKHFVAVLEEELNYLFRVVYKPLVRVLCSIVVEVCYCCRKLCYKVLVYLGSILYYLHVIAVDDFVLLFYDLRKSVNLDADRIDDRIDLCCNACYKRCCVLICDGRKGDCCLAYIVKAYCYVLVKLYKCVIGVLVKLICFLYECYEAVDVLDNVCKRLIDE